MTNGEAINWIINLTADIGKAEHRDLWHYEQALYEIREILEQTRKGKWMGTVCSACGESFPDNDIYDANFCPNCGARMSEGEENERA